MKPTRYRTRRTLSERFADLDPLIAAICILAGIGILGAIGNALADWVTL
jgi:hypothetical protein